MAQVKFSRQARVCAKKRDLKEKSLQRKNDYGAERGAHEIPPNRHCIIGCVRGKIRRFSLAHKFDTTPKSGFTVFCQTGTEHFLKERKQDICGKGGEGETRTPTLFST